MASMGLYRAVGRPLMFALRPETAHRIASLALRLPLPWGWIGGAIGDPALVTDLAGIRLRNAVGLAAGFDKDARMLEGLGRLGFGYLVAGSVSRAPREGYARPRIVRRPADGAIVNSMGLPNDGVDAVAARLLRLRKTVPLLVSLADEAPEDVAHDLATLDPFCDGFELNVSSPNSPWRHGRTDNARYLADALSAVVPAKRRPLFVKLPPAPAPEEAAEVLGLARVAIEAGAEGLTCSNTVPVEESRLARGRGGLSGRPLSEETPRLVERVRAAVGDRPAINASGGIFTGSDARRCLDAGATSVQIYTGLIYEGPRILREITSSLAVAASGTPRQDV